MMNAAQAIKTYREQAGLSQAKFAKRIGVTQGLIGHYETGLKRPSANAAVAIEKATNGAIQRSQLRPDLFD